MKNNGLLEAAKAAKQLCDSIARKKSYSKLFPEAAGLSGWLQEEIDKEDPTRIYTKNQQTVEHLIKVFKIDADHGKYILDFHYRTEYHKRHSSAALNTLIRQGKVKLLKQDEKIKRYQYIGE